MSAPTQISERQLLANQRNARKSTGPATPEGKSVARNNALKHGLCSTQTILPFEDAAQYEALLAGLRQAHAPIDEPEDSAVRLIAHQYWRINRHFRVESGTFNFQSRLVKFHNEIGPDESGDPDEMLGIVFSEQGQVFDRLSRYESRIVRNYYKAVDQLTALQKTRDLRRPVSSFLPATQIAAPEAAAENPSVPEPERALQSDQNVPAAIEVEVPASTAFEYEPVPTKVSGNGNGFVRQNPVLAPPSPPPHTVNPEQITRTAHLAAAQNHLLRRAEAA